MKVEVNEKPVEQESKYPYIGIRKDEYDYTIVYFISKDCGICLDTDFYGDKIGEYSKEWNENIFPPFTGSITLSND